MQITRSVPIEIGCTKILYTARRRTIGGLLVIAVRFHLSNEMLDDAGNSYGSCLVVAMKVTSPSMSTTTLRYVIDLFVLRIFLDTIACPGTIKVKKKRTAD